MAYGLVPVSAKLQDGMRTQELVLALIETGVFGNDWPTPDGTCIRDYIHVVDLIEAHIKALEKISSGKHRIINLGSGTGHSVEEVISAASKVVGHEIPREYSPRRAGDPAVLVADISRAKSELGWSPTRLLEEMVRDTWESQKD